MARKPAKLSRKPVTGSFIPTVKELAIPIEHHVGWDKALDKALLDIGRPRGTYHVSITYTAVVDVTKNGRNSTKGVWPAGL